MSTEVFASHEDFLDAFQQIAGIWDEALRAAIAAREDGRDRPLVVLRDYKYAALDASSFVDVADARSLSNGYVTVWIRGLQGFTPEFLIKHVERYLQERAPINIQVLVAPHVGRWAA